MKKTHLPKCIAFATVLLTLTLAHGAGSTDDSLERIKPYRQWLSVSPEILKTGGIIGTSTGA
jgi:hypothetical protein